MVQMLLMWLSTLGVIFLIGPLLLPWDGHIYMLTAPSGFVLGLKLFYTTTTAVLLAVSVYHTRTNRRYVNAWLEQLFGSDIERPGKIGDIPYDEGDDW